MLKLSEAGGEQYVIDWFVTHVDTANLPVGIGDDCAALPPSDQTLVTTDMLIENIHFRTDINRYYDIGWKSVAVNLSDIASMGGKPTYTFLSIGLPDIDIEDVNNLFSGIADCIKSAGAILAGGDTVSSPAGIVINVTALGALGPAGAVKRSGAQAGDSVLVTGTLGDSLAGLQLLLEHGLAECEQRFAYLVKRHLRPEPQLSASAAMAATGHVKSMMDLSDGLCKDIRRLCKSSAVGAVVHSAWLPLSEQLLAAATQTGLDPVSLAASGGEEYELLFTCAPEHVQAVKGAAEGSGTSAQVIGEITEGPEVVLLNISDQQILWPDPWEHF